MLKLTYFCLNLLVQQINLKSKLKSNYIEKLNKENKKTLQKRFGTVVAYSELKYGIVLRNLDIVRPIYVLQPKAAQ